jgi:hypothetical protein
MNAQQRYREQLRLQAALGRTLEVLIRVASKGLGPTTGTTLAALGLIELLNAWLRGDSREELEELAKSGELTLGALQRAALGVRRRRKESRARTKRKGRAKARPRTDKKGTDS